MPVIVVGADSPLGAAIVDTLGSRSGERRAFVGSPTAAGPLRAAGFKVAVGDISDSTHVEAAMLGCFSAILVTEAASDGRELAFAADAHAVIDSWIAAVAPAGVNRVIFVGPARPAPAGVEWAVVDPQGKTPTAIGEAVALLDEAREV